MSTTYSPLARQIIDALGGPDNIKQAYHCQTRLRFVPIESSATDDEALTAIPDVVRVLHSAGQVQVVIGPHVADVFADVARLLPATAVGQGSGQDAPEGGEHRNPAEVVIDFVAGTFQPIIPALSGAGMVKAVMALLVVFNIADTTSPTYSMLNIFADGVFYFLPVLLAFTAAQKLQCNPILAAGVAFMLVHPQWTAYVGAGDPMHLFGVIPLVLTSYGNTVIPMLLIVLVQSYVERYLNRAIPKSVNLVFVPLLTFLVMGTLAFSLLGPIGAVLGSWLGALFTFLAVNAAWAPAVIVGGLLPIMVMFGIHNAIAPLGVMQMSQLGFDSIFGPGCFISNMCQATAGAVVALRTKNTSVRTLATSGSITAWMGITEPILYGVNLPRKYPLVSAMIGGACGGLYAGLTHTHRFATGSSGLPAVLLYLGDNTVTILINIIIAALIGIVITAVLTFFLYSRYEKDATEVVTDNPLLASTDPAEAVVVQAPVSGVALPITEAADEVFAEKIAGDGAAIDPTSDSVVAPVSGTIIAVFPTKHAIGIAADNGSQVLIHLGINTVELKGQYFDISVAKGDRVTAGEVIGTFDRESIAAAGYNTQTMVLISNTKAYSEITLSYPGQVAAGGPLLTLTPAVLTTQE